MKTADRQPSLKPGKSLQWAAKLGGEACRPLKEACYLRLSQKPNGKLGAGKRSNRAHRRKKKEEIAGAEKKKKKKEKA